MHNELLFIYSYTRWLKFKLRKYQKRHKDYSMQYVFLRKHQKLQRDPIWKALHVMNSQESCIATIPNSQQTQPPSPFIKWKVNFTRATTTHVCSMLLLMQNINPLTGINVVQMESWPLLHRHFFWDEATKSGKRWH